MRVEVREPKPWLRVLEIEAPLDLMKEEVERLYREYGREVSLPGFRKGRVPEGLIRAKYGKAIERRALERAIPKIYEQALNQTHEKPITKAQVEDIKYQPEGGVSFRAVFEIVPAVEIRGYQGIYLEKRARRVSRTRVKEELQVLRELHKELGTIDRPSQEGDYIIVDYAGRDGDGRLLEGISASNYSLLLNGDGIATSLLGMREGERREVLHTYPEDWGDRKLAGRSVVYDFLVKEVKEARLPRLDNDFAKDVGFESLKELTEKIRENLARQDQKAAREELESQLMERLIESHPFDPSPSLVEGYLSGMVEEAKRSVPSGESFDERQLRAEKRPLAEYRAKRGIILDRIAELEKIEVTAEEEGDRIKEMADGSKMDYDRLKGLLESTGDIQAIRAGLRREKTLRFLIENARIRQVRRRDE